MHGMHETDNLLPSFSVALLDIKYFLGEFVFPSSYIFPSIFVLKHHSFALFCVNQFKFLSTGRVQVLISFVSELRHGIQTTDVRRE